MPAIPLIEVGADGVAAVLAAERARAEALLAAGRRRYTAVGIALGDRVARRWLALSGNPYLPEIDAVAAALGRPGAHALNLSYEWSCTTGVAADPAGAGSRLLRVLDWPMEGLGRHVLLLRHASRAGPWLNLSWPGFSGVLTALAPGRFAAALNQPPMRRRTPLVASDWLLNRIGVLRSRHLPPTHLLRQVFETCRSYAEAKERLTAAPLCLPAFFTLSGTRPDEGCVIERLEERAAVHEAPAVAANHWLAPGLGSGESQRGRDSHARQRLLAERLQAPAGAGFDWLAPPVLNDQTRLAVVANAATGSLLAQGWEGYRPATAPLRLAAAGEV